MDPNFANELSINGATFILLDMPIGSEFGIDSNVYRVGEKFRGIKMIPPGLHLIYYSSVSKTDGSVAPRTAFFQHFTTKQVIVKKWNAHEEDVAVDPVDEEQVRRLTDNIRGTLDEFLAPYPYTNYTKWVGLTDYIDDSALRLLNPRCGKIKSVTHLIPQKYEMIKNRGKGSELPKVDKDSLPVMDPDPDSAINFSKIPKHRYPPSAGAEERTKYSIDSSYAMEQMMSRFPLYKQFLGELQFSFVSFLVAQVYDGLEHWQNLLKIFCTSEESMHKHEQLYLDFIRVIYFQVQEVPEDLFVDIVENNNFLVAYLRLFFSNIELSSTISEVLKEKANKFKSHVSGKYKWDFDGEPDDEAPIVVLF